jgi:LPS-assembly lipoprotein
MSTALTAGLAGCGFELRKPPSYAFKTLYSSIPVVSPFGVKLKRSLESSGQVEVISDPREVERAQVIFDQLFELREKVVVGRTATGAIREFQLRLRYRFRLRSKSGIELIPDTEIILNRDINFNETGALSKEAEEALLYKDMENDLVLQIQRRLAAVRQI